MQIAFEAVVLARRNKQEIQSQNRGRQRLLRKLPRSWRSTSWERAVVCRILQTGPADGMRFHVFWARAAAQTHTKSTIVHEYQLTNGFYLSDPAAPFTPSCEENLLPSVAVDCEGGDLQSLCESLVAIKPPRYKPVMRRMEVEPTAALKMSLETSSVVEQRKHLSGYCEKQ
ncbi:unnamed protein product [Amoebophrya sp. A120]|nr:unnamed protein product [Amoebophrya sp. A120]|eukprot:GSA120T00025484001.1